jgi:anterior pharynx defective protein 1
VGRTGGGSVATLTLSPATFYVAACPQMNVFLYSAMTSCAFVVLHTFSMVLAFDGYAHRSVVCIALPPVIHLLAALAVRSPLKPSNHRTSNAI